MSKTVEVLFRLHSVQPPESLGVESFPRDQEFLKRERVRLGILPGKKILETRLPKDKPWRLDRVVADLREGGHSLIHMNVEFCPGFNFGSVEPVLNLLFKQTGQTTCTSGQLTWAEEYLGGAVFKLARAYDNPREDGSSQIAVDCLGSAAPEPGQKYLPMRRLIGLPVEKPVLAVRF